MYILVWNSRVGRVRLGSRTGQTWENWSLSRGCLLTYFASYFLSFRRDLTRLTIRHILSIPAGHLTYPRLPLLLSRIEVAVAVQGVGHVDSTKTQSCHNPTANCHCPWHNSIQILKDNKVNWTVKVEKWHHDTSIFHAEMIECDFMSLSN